MSHLRAHDILPPASLVLLSTLLVATSGCGSTPSEPGNGVGGTTGNPSGGTTGNPSGGTTGNPSGGTTGNPSGGTTGNPSGGTTGNPSGGTTGSPSGGTTGNSSGGTTGSSGGSENGGGDGVVASMGCGETAPAAGRASIEVGGKTREYILALPANYDPEKPYKLIFTWHPWGGSAQQVAGNGPSGYYGLFGASEGEAILVSPEGLDFGGNGLGWGNSNGEDIAFLRAMIERFDAELCFDHNRLFSTGFSFGGMMSNAVACAGLARAVAPMAGNASVAGCENGTKPVAYMGFHGNADTVVDISGGEAARDKFIERNGCGSATPSDSQWCEGAGAERQPCECTTYEGCEAGYPVTWCEFTGPHMVAPNSAQTIWDFFAQF